MPPFSCEAQDRGGEYSISGVVVNSQTGEPVRQALVTGSGMRETSEDATNDATNGEDAAVHALGNDAIEPLLTDASGAFHWRGLQAGTYTLSAEKPGFASENDQATPLKLGPSREGVTIRLSPLGSISGRVLDGDGEPVPGVNVRALSSRIENGRRVVSQTRSVYTDDLGRYHLWNLSPGSYYIQAAGRSGTTQFYVGPSPTVVGAHEGFEPLFYPAAADWKSATPVTITPGASVEASLQVAMQPAFRVTGTIRGHDPAQTIEVQAVRSDGSASGARATVAPGSGRFAIYDLVPGAYSIRARQQQGTSSLYARQEVRIGAADVEGVALEMAPGANVKVVIHGTPPKAEEQPVEGQEQQGQPASTMAQEPVAEGQQADAQPVRPQAPSAFVQLEDPDDPEGANHAPMAPAAADGSLIIPGVPEGRYRVLIHSLGGYVASATAGGQDLLRGGLLTVAAGVPPPVVEVLLQFDFGTISGTVAAEAAGPERWVLIVPVAPGREPFMAPTENGGFELLSVAPDDYRVFLLAGQDTVEYANPGVVSALRGGEDVHVTANGKAEVVLKELAQ